MECFTAPHLLFVLEHPANYNARNEALGAIAQAVDVHDDNLVGIEIDAVRRGLFGLIP